ncbi:hypothetical protein [Rhizobium sp. TRM95796]|uniref:hypothetical protein n=1 Tax=Rhizobium sp. TRM95796 TaxID=2979862 RepID=UPI0021E76D94|nr:hypothetical protein [Rhizobium sp. TRM95796]MCV3766649.1 hypothetical protein [Rhizobium sp. TRM95796]
MSIAAAWVLALATDTHSRSPNGADSVAAIQSVSRKIVIAENNEDQTPASLYLACTTSAARHLLLSTRLPGPRDDYRKGNKDDAFLYVETIEQKMDLKWTLAERGKDDPWGGYLFWRKNLDEPDTLISAPLTGDQIATISRWFGHAPPSEVSIIGFLETGVSMTGKATGKAIADFDASCSAK